MKTNTKLRVVIAEDEPLARETLRNIILTRSDLELVGEADNGQTALQLVNSLQPDLLLLDIQMPELTGIEVAKRIEHRPKIIFATAYDQFAITAFELQAIDYLLKPFTNQRLHDAIDRIVEEGRILGTETLHELEQSTQAMSQPLARILVRDRGHIFPLQTKNIEYLKADSKYTSVHVNGKTWLVRLGIAELESRLDPTQFIRIHRSVIVNLDFVLTMKADEQSQLQLHMTDGTILMANREVSKRLRDESI